ncbi:TPA: adenylosuccinate lyase [Candidatus Micrarchaeota archaeon]|nr:adenylosuccinate lyase [Candidatus Micrarchaeota archaeon]
MINRYSLSPMKELWSEETMYKKWLEVEIAVLKAFEKLKMIPKGTTEKIVEKVKININDIKEREKQVKHDMIAFLESIEEQIGDLSRYFHKGLTSSDVKDTALSLILVESGKILLGDIENIKKLLIKMARKYKNTVMIGRTHGIHAEPITFGLKVLSWLSEFERNEERLKEAVENIKYGKISGAVGTYTHISPEVEEEALSILELKREKISTQIIPRDRHAQFILTLSLIGASVERIAIEIRNLQRTEIEEVEEPFYESQKGSSAMPHKRNPIVSERLCGLSRILRAYTSVALENILLWHERDLTHSSAERFLFSETTQILHYMLVKLKEILENLRVNESNMLRNLDITKGLIYSEGILIKLMEKGIPRKKAYEIVQQDAAKAWKDGKRFLEVLLEDDRIIENMSEAELRELLSTSYYLKHIDIIFRRFENDSQR